MSSTKLSLYPLQTFVLHRQNYTRTQTHKHTCTHTKKLPHMIGLVACRKLKSSPVVCFISIWLVTRLIFISFTHFEVQRYMHHFYSMEKLGMHSVPISSCLNNPGSTIIPLFIVLIILYYIWMNIDTNMHVYILAQ